MSKLDFAILFALLLGLIYITVVLVPAQIDEDSMKDFVCKSKGYDSAVYYDYSVDTKTLDGQVFIRCIKNEATEWVPLNYTSDNDE